MPYLGLSNKVKKVEPSPTLSLRKVVVDMKNKGKKVIDFGSGDPNFSTPSHIIDSAIQAINDGHTHYTSASGIDQLKKAVQEKLEKDNALFYEKDQIVITCGAKGAIYNILQIICQEGDEVIIIAPYYLSYPEMIKLAGARPIIISTSEEEKFKLSPYLLDKSITDKTKAILFNSPVNPSGAVYTQQELEGIADVIVKKGIYLISDEIYEKIIYDGRKHVALASLNNEINKLTFTVNGFAKTYAMTGWRMGYAAGPKEVISIMGRLQSQSIGCLSGFVQMACVAALQGSQDCVLEMVEEYTRRRDYMVERLQKIGLFCEKPEGAFYVFPNVSKYFGKKYNKQIINDSRDFSRILLEEAMVAIVFGGAYGTDDYVRLCFACSSMDEIKGGMDRVEEFLCKLK